jgi:glycosyltransferase involved in cell wall biosynthesis
VNRLLLERRDRVVGVGQSVRRALIQNEGIPASRVGVIYNGIDTANFRGALHDKASVRRDLGLDPADFVVLMVARLDYLKDHATAVRTIQRVIAQRPKAKLVLVGEGPERNAIQQTVDNLQLHDSVKFLGLRKDVSRLLNGADLFLLTSISEGIPLTVIEAMLTDLPVVATNVGGLPEVVEEGQTGLLAPAGDDAGLASHIIRLADSADLRQKMGRQGRERAERLFSESQMLSRYLALYQEMIRG